MLTGDNFRTAEAVAARTGIDEFHAEVLPEDKARYVLQEKENNRTVVMLGDGINDSPALSAADVGIAISDGAPIARQVADITVRGNDLSVLTDLRKLSVGLERRVRKNYRLILGFNSALIIGGILGILTPATAAYLHNFSTLGISFAAMQPIKY